jgi:hypothetical protein
MSSISARKRAGGRGSAGPKEEHDGLQERARRRTGASGQGGHMVSSLPDCPVNGQKDEEP